MTMLITYFDTLSSGMKAKLDPNFRLSTRREPVYVVPIPHKKVDFAHSGHTLPPIAKRNQTKYWGAR